jgi:hypothetical protein
MCASCMEVGADREGERVWAKVKSFPWWPATITREPTLGVCRKPNGQVCALLHTQTPRGRQTQRG